MKKSILLLPLVLAACGGGSGSGGSGGGGTLPERAAISDTTIASNAAITKMVSEMGISSDGGAIVNSGRAASGTFNHNGTIYTTYRLDDVNFKSLLTTGATDRMRLQVDAGGRITGIRFINDSHQPQPPELFSNIARDGETNQFKTNLTEQGPTTFTYDSYGATLGLKYMDFGVIRAEVGGQTFDIPFAGGYEAARIKQNPPANVYTFTGKAAGFLMDGSGDSKNIATTNNGATLVIDQSAKTETLSAAFSDWYDIRVVNNFGIGAITFTTSNKTGTGWEISTPTANMQNGGHIGQETILFELNAYSENGKGAPTEASVLFNYQTKDTSSINVMLGFGGKTNP